MSFDQIKALLIENQSRLASDEWTNLTIITNEIISMSKEYKQLNSDISDLNETNKAIENRAKIKENSEINENLEDKLLEMDDQIQKKTKEVDSLRHDYKKLKKKMKKLSNKNTVLEEECNIKKTQISSLKKEKKQKRLQLKSKNAELNKSIDEIKVLTDKRANFEQEIKSLDEKLNKLKLKQNKSQIFDTHLKSPLRKNQFPKSTDNLLRKVDDSHLNSSDDDPPETKEIFQLSKAKALHSKCIVTVIKCANTKPFFASAAEDGTVKISNYYTLDTIKSFSNKSSVLSGDFNSDDSLFLATSADSIIRVFKTKTWNTKVKNKDNNSGVYMAKFWDQDKYISCSLDGFLKLYNVKSTFPTYKMHCSSPPKCLAKYDAYAPLILAGHSDGSIRLWDIRSKSPANLIQAHKSEISHIFSIAKASKVVTLSLDKTIKITDLRNDRVIGTINVSKTGIRSRKTQFARLNNSVIIGTNNNSIYQYSLENFELINQIKVNEDNDWIVSLDITNNSVITGSKAGIVSQISIQ